MPLTSVDGERREETGSTLTGDNLRGQRRILRARRKTQLLPESIVLALQRLYRPFQSLILFQVLQEPFVICAQPTELTHRPNGVPNGAPHGSKTILYAGKGAAQRIIRADSVGISAGHGRNEPEQH
jgi:hypothetical protein